MAEIIRRKRFGMFMSCIQEIWIGSRQFFPTQGTGIRFSSIIEAGRIGNVSRRATYPQNKLAGGLKFLPIKTFGPFCAGHWRGMEEVLSFLKLR